MLGAVEEPDATWLTSKFLRRGVEARCACLASQTLQQWVGLWGDSFGVFCRLLRGGSAAPKDKKDIEMNNGYILLNMSFDDTLGLQKVSGGLSLLLGSGALKGICSPITAQYKDSCLRCLRRRGSRWSAPRI